MGMMPELESIYPEGSDITIMNTFYSYPKYEDGHKVHDDFIILIYKDNNTGKKHSKTIWKPEYTYYKTKDPNDIPNYNQLFIERDRVEPVCVPFTKLEESIAEVTGKTEFYKRNLELRQKSANRRLHMEPGIFYSDANIENHYRFKFSNTYTNDIRKIYKGFFDIEVDGKWSNYDFVQMGECAINCVSFYDEKTDKVYVFILKDDRNPLIEEFEKEIYDGTFGFKEIHEFVEENVNGPEMMEKYGLTNTQFSLQFYEYEIELIKDLFATMHRCSPDFIEGWNSSAFDIEYIIARIYELGYEPADIMCDQSFEIKVVRNYVDQKNINMAPERGDFTFISGLPVFIDQMIQYASRRKAKWGSITSVKLDDIGLKEAGVRKLDYSHITKSVTELPWLDFKTFVLYNIMDVIVQKCIETKTQDLEYIFAKCVVNNTVYNKGHRQTVYLINRMAADWYKMGYIIGNNCNRENEKPPKFVGALVSDPLKTDDYSKLKIGGRAIWVCDNLVDFDFRALYPSVIAEFNIAPNTQIGRIEIDEKIYDNENVYNEEHYSRGGEFVENLVTDNTIEFSHRWFKLANFEEFIQDMDEYYEKLSGLGQYSKIESNWRSVLIPSNKVKSVVSFTGRRAYSPVSFYNERNKSITYEKLMEGKQ